MRVIAVLRAARPTNLTSLCQPNRLRRRRSLKRRLSLRSLSVGRGTAATAARRGGTPSSTAEIWVILLLFVVVLLHLIFALTVPNDFLLGNGYKYLGKHLLALLKQDFKFWQYLGTGMAPTGRIKSES